MLPSISFECRKHWIVHAWKKVNVSISLSINRDKSIHTVNVGIKQNSIENIFSTYTSVLRGVSVFISNMFRNLVKNSIINFQNNT